MKLNYSSFFFLVLTLRNTFLRFIFNFSFTCTVVFQLIEGASAQQKEGLGLMTPDYYYYLNQSGTYKVDGTNDSKDFQETMVQNLGISCCDYVTCFLPFLKYLLLMN